MPPRCAQLVGNIWLARVADDVLQRQAGRLFVAHVDSEYCAGCGIDCGGGSACTRRVPQRGKVSRRRRPFHRVGVTVLQHKG